MGFVVGMCVAQLVWVQTRDPLPSVSIAEMISVDCHAQVPFYLKKFLKRIY